MQDLNQFLTQYKMMQKMMSGKGGGMMAGMKNMMGMGKGNLPGAGLEGLGDLGNIDWRCHGRARGLWERSLNKLTVGSSL